MNHLYCDVCGKVVVVLAEGSKIRTTGVVCYCVEHSPTHKKEENAFEDVFGSIFGGKHAK